MHMKVFGVARNFLARGTNRSINFVESGFGERDGVDKAIVLYKFREKISSISLSEDTILPEEGKQLTV